MTTCLFHPLRPWLWGAQLIEPYVDEEVSWAVRVHQALRLLPRRIVGYKYPDMYVKYFGQDYKPEPYIVEEYKRAGGTSIT
jgi:hypothetical protein